MGDTPFMKVSTFLVICTNLQKFTLLILPKADFGGLFPSKST